MFYTNFRSKEVFRMNFYRRDRARPHKRERTKRGKDKWGTRSCRGRALRRPYSPIHQSRRKARPFGDAPFVLGAARTFAPMGLAPVRATRRRHVAVRCVCVCSQLSDRGRALSLRFGLTGGLTLLLEQVGQPLSLRICRHLYL